MKIIQGFVTIPDLTDNRVNQIAKFGELSPTSQTFTRDLRNYSNTTTFPDIEVFTLKAIDENNVNIDLPGEVVSRMLTVSSWVYNQYKKNAIPVNSSKTVFEASVSSELPFTFAVRIGEILATDTPSKRLIDYIRFDTTFNNETYRLTLWFSDSRFRSQYRYYEIEVIPPVDSISRLIGTLPNVAVALNAVKLQSVTKRINDQNRKAKITEIQTMSLNWHDPNDKPDTKTPGILNTDWTLLIYGNAGADTEAMKAAIRDYLYAHSDYDKWETIYPDLFASNEFVFIPFWDLSATPKSNYDDGFYNSWVSTGFLNLARLKYIPPEYKVGAGSDVFIASNTIVGTVFYRSMCFMSLGNPSNKNGVVTVQQLFPDYTNVSTTSPDFGRMSTRTQSFVLKLNECFNKARLYTPYEVFPEGYTLAIKATREYIGFDFDGFTFYVMTRQGYLREI